MTDRHCVLKPCSPAKQHQHNLCALPGSAGKSPISQCWSSLVSFGLIRGPDWQLTKWFRLPISGVMAVCCAPPAYLPGAGDRAAKNPLSHYHLELGLSGKQDTICHRTPWAPSGTNSRSLYIFFVSPLSLLLSICHHLSCSRALIKSSPIFSLTPTLFFLVCSLSFSFSRSHIPPLYSPFQIFYLSICFARPSTPHMKSLHLWINFSSIYEQLSLFPLKSDSKQTANNGSSVLQKKT